MGNADDTNDHQSSKMFSGPNPWGLIVLFAAASVCALIGIFESHYSISQRYALAAGWLVASIILIAATNKTIPSSKGYQASKMFSGPSPWGSVVLFAAASICALIGAFKSHYSVSQQFALAAGWLVASVLVAAATNNAALSFTDARDRQEPITQGLLSAAKKKQEICDQSLCQAIDQWDDAQKMPDGPGRSAAVSAAEKSLANVRSEVENVRADYLAVLQRDASADREVISSTLLMNIVVFVVSGLLIVTFWNAGEVRQWASCMIWSVSCLLLGGVAGLLFGIPRSRSDAQTSTRIAAPLSQQGNGQSAGTRIVTTGRNDQSAIEQLADWLTKTIVGVGLVNLTKIPGLLNNWATYISRSTANTGPNYVAGIVAGPGPSFAVAMIVYFTVAGFLCGYLVTQMFLLPYLNKIS